MNPDNKRAARERRAAEKEREKKVKTGKLLVLIAVIVLAVVLLLWGLSRSGTSGAGKSGQGSETESQSQDGQNKEQKDSSQTKDQKTSGSDTNQTDSAKTDPGYKAQKGDTAVIHYVGKVGDTAFYGGTGDYDLKLGSGSFISGFEDQVIGHKKGETFDVHVTFPANYRSSYAMKQDGQADTSRPITLAGTEATFTVTIQEIK